jgi:hypothetical protein
LQSEGHRPQAEPGDLQADPAESGVLHARTLYASTRSPRPAPFNLGNRTAWLVIAAIVAAPAGLAAIAVAAGP